MCISAGVQSVCSEACERLADCPVLDVQHPTICWMGSICVIPCEGSSDCLEGMTCEQFCLWP